MANWAACRRRSRWVAPGTSRRNWKGIFKGLANARRLAQRRAGETGMMSGEDLSNVGPVALSQDLAVQAALGADERGAQRARRISKALSAWPAGSARRAFWRSTAMLYTRASGADWPRVNVVGGDVQIGSVTRAVGLGAELPPLEEIAATEC